jgi:hypothetical protein
MKHLRFASEYRDIFWEFEAMISIWSMPRRDQHRTLISYAVESHLLVVSGWGPLLNMMIYESSTRCSAQKPLDLTVPETDFHHRRFQSG